MLERVPPPTILEASCEFGQGLREICRANNSSEQQQIKALLRSVGTAMCPDYTDWFGSGAADATAKASDRSLVLKFIQSHPADYATSKLQVISFAKHCAMSKVQASFNEKTFSSFLVHLLFCSS